MRRLQQTIYFPIIVGIHFIFWIIDLAMYSGDYKFTTQHIIGEVFSSWVVTVFAFNFLMATRAHWVEKIFGGLDKMYFIHRRSAKIGMTLLVLHFIIVPKTMIFQIGKPMGFFALILILFGVVFSIAKPFKRRIPYHKWNIIHKGMGLFYTIGVAHALFVPNLTSELPIVRAYVFGMSLVGVFAWIYKAFLYNLFNKKLKYTTTSIKKFSHDLLEVTLKSRNGKLAFKPGQFVYVSFSGINKGEAHPFTISNHPSEENIRLTIKASGDYTSDLQTSLQEGVESKVEGPFGLFDFATAKYKKQLWLAGGIGITPYLSFLKEADESYNIDLAWSVKTLDDAPYKEEIEQIITEKKNINFNLNNSDQKGFFAIEQFYSSEELKECSIFICGPEVMRESYIEQLLRKGVSIRDIHYEEFSFR